MPHYKLVYFNGRGIAETIRMLFAVADVKYDDRRIEENEWTEIKPATPFGQLPVLEVDGRKLAQSNAISRYLAEKFDLMGRNPIEKAAIDGCCETISEIRDKMMDIEKKKVTKTVKNQEMERLLRETIPEILEKLERCLRKNKGGDTYFYGDEMSLADIHFFACCEPLVKVKPDIFVDFPKLGALYDRVRNQRKIDAWLQQRPDTDF